MPSLVSSAIAQPARNQHLLLLQSSHAQTCLPIVRAVVKHASERARETIVLFCFLYPPSSFLDSSSAQSEHVRIVDRTGHVPGYDDDLDAEGSQVSSLKNLVLEAVQSTAAGPVNVIIDSVDTLLSDVGSVSETTRLLSELLAIVRTRGGTSRLILHILSPCPLLSILTQTRFSPTLTHLIAHPPALLTHLASAYLTPPPPLSAPEKFWGVFIPVSERPYESERLVFGAGGEGSGASREFAVEVLVRGGADGSAGRRRGVERVLEGWSTAAGGPCELRELDSLKALWAKKPVVETQQAPDPTQNLSFNLNLTPEQQRSRAQVPLPYAHEGKPAGQTNAPAVILYDPDSADDLDDDDPDEDLDI